MFRKSFQNALKSKEIHHRTRKKLKNFPPAAGKEKTHLKTLFESTIVCLYRAEGAKIFGGVYRVYMNIVSERFAAAVTFWICVYIIYIACYFPVPLHAETLPDALVSCVGKLLTKD